MKFLVGDNNIVKIADFGLARLIKEDEYKARVRPGSPSSGPRPRPPTTAGSALRATSGFSE